MAQAFQEGSQAACVNDGLEDLEEWLDEEILEAGRP